MDNPLLQVAVFAGGVLFGLLIAYVSRMMQSKNGEKIAREILRESDKNRQANDKLMLTAVQNSFGKMSVAVLNKTNETFLQMAEQRLNTQTTAHSSELDSKKKLIDQQLGNMAAELGRVTELVKAFEDDRNKKYGALGEQLTALNKTSTMLQRALADNRSRGQWGERIAEDVLRMAGFIENVNYRKQVVLESSRPDYTFLLPRNLTLNMDVKFPLDNYMKYLEATADVDREKYCKDFLRDARSRVNEIIKRGYINPEQSTVDCVLVFIPNEQIYRFIHEEDDGIIDEALKQKVILCSPLTLFIVLAIIRQASDNFALEMSSREILILLNNFKKQWTYFAAKMDEVDKRLRRTYESYSELMLKRKNELEKPIKNIESLMLKHGVDDTSGPPVEALSLGIETELSASAEIFEDD